MPPIHAPSLSCRCRRRTATRSRCPRRRRKGSVLILFAVLFVALLGIMAFAIDIGVNVHHRASLQNAADASALAAADVWNGAGGGQQPRSSLDGNAVLSS